MKNWTDETDIQADAFFARLSERDIRQRQDLCREQIVLAHTLRNADALADLRRMEDALCRAMLVRV